MDFSIMNFSMFPEKEKIGYSIIIDSENLIILVITPTQL